MTPSLSVVVPVHNEARDLAATLTALLRALERSGLETEVVLVDDGSTDGSALIANDTVGGRVPLHVLTQPNRGRFEARRAGVEAAQGQFVLLLDARVAIDDGALAFACERITNGDRVWTSHVHVRAEGNLLGLFWQLLAELAWSDYFDRPRTTSFGAAEFDRFPKGTTCFLAPRELLLDAMNAFHTAYADNRHANDDTPLIRWIAEHERIHVSPHYASSYRPRETLGAFLRHAFHRGVVFLDGHGRRESRFFPVVVLSYPLSGALFALSLRRPAVAGGALGLVSLGALALGLRHRRRSRELVSLALVTPLYAAAHEAGMWRGLLMRLGRPR
jgi:glycosyltransferase involved in cell wall biosynthesis